MRFLFTVLLAMMPLSLLAQGGPAPVSVTTAELAMLAPTITVPGTVVSRHDAQLAAEVPGNIAEIAEIGDFVEKDQVVAKILKDLLEQQRIENEGLVNSRKTRISFLEREVERLRRLAAQNNAARSQLDQTESDLLVARSDLVVARARLAQILIALSRSEIRAPFAGRITQRFVTLGEHVGTGDPVVRLVSTSKVEIVARAPLKTGRFISEGSTINVDGEVGAGNGTIRAVVPFGDARTHMIELRIDVPAEDWIIGESVRITVPTATPKQVLAVPRDALILRADGTAVFKISDENKAERIAVQTGSGDGELIAVTGELEAGDRIVIRGGERLRPGQDVTIDSGGAGARPESSASQ